jgi:prepilin-type N-terminal cleavage/methylation domain-containing protein
MRTEERVTTTQSRRRAFTLLELAVAAALLAVLLTMITKAFAAVERNMRRTDERAQALRTVENLLEELTLASWNEINDDGIGQLKLPDDLLRRWPQAKLVGEVVDDAEPVAAKRVTLSVQPQGPVRERSVTLTTWVYRAPEK